MLPARSQRARDCAIVKRHQVDIRPHETLGGGFSPPCVKLMGRLASKSKEGVDRTRYVTRSGTRRHLSFKVHHASRISIACVKYNAKGIKREAGFVASRASVAARLAVVHEAHPAA